MFYQKAILKTLHGAETDNGERRDNEQLLLIFVVFLQSTNDKIDLRLQLLSVCTMPIGIGKQTKEKNNNKIQT